MIFSVTAYHIIPIHTQLLINEQSQGTACFAKGHVENNEAKV